MGEGRKKEQKAKMPHVKRERKTLPAYRDYSKEVKPAREEEAPLALYSSEAHRTHLLNGNTQNFACKLHYMLHAIEAKGLAGVVSWQPHGRCFKVHNQDIFVNEILPLWFRQSQFPSFQRQLNLYGFTRLCSGRDKGSYYHEFFLRGKIFLAKRIQRSRINGERIRKSNAAESEPTFYELPFLPEFECAPTRIHPTPGTGYAPNPVGLSTFGGVPQEPNVSMERRQQLIAQLAMGRPMPALRYQEVMSRRIYSAGFPSSPNLSVGAFAPRGRPVTSRELLLSMPPPQRSPLLQALLRLPFPQKQPIPQHQASTKFSLAQHSSCDPRLGLT